MAAINFFADKGLNKIAIGQIYGLLYLMLSKQKLCQYQTIFTITVLNLN